MLSSWYPPHGSDPLRRVLPITLPVLAALSCAPPSAPLLQPDEAAVSSGERGVPDSGAPAGDTGESSGEGAEDAPRHVLLVILDDIGLDAAPMYDNAGGGLEDAPMPTFTSVCEEGVQFWRAWSSPSCSPTRAGLMTGRYGFRTGIGAPLVSTGALPLSEVTLPELLRSQLPDIALASIGKWHLGIDDEVGGSEAPNRHGWPHFAGPLTGTLEAYDAWSRVEDGVENTVTDYATSRTVDDAILWLGEQDRAEPWFLWVAFNAPHDPFHVPPSELHSYADLTTDEDEIADDPLEHYQAALEALDTELARLLDWIERHEHGPVDVILIGDNGTPKEVIDDAIGTTRAKGSVFEGGVNVPMCIRGPSVADGGRDSHALVQTIDIFSTVVELFAVDPELHQPAPHRDAVSLLPILNNSASETRQWIYTERFNAYATGATSRAQAVRSDRYKLIHTDTDADGDTDTEQLYDLSVDPHEHSDLLEGTLSTREQAAYDLLSARLDSIR